MLQKDLEMFEKIVLFVLRILSQWGLAKKQAADAKKARATGKTLESVNESLDVEKEIRDKQKKSEKSDVQTDDGGLNFDRFNRDSG